MKIRIQDIPVEGLDFKASAPQEAWWGDLVREAFGEWYQPEETAALKLFIQKTCETIRLTGTAEVNLVPICDRCAESFKDRLSIPIDFILSSKSGEETESDNEEDDAGDISFAYYSGDEVDLDELLREALLLEIPIHFYCRGDCKGLCPKCGTNWNEKICSCKQESRDPRFEVLKKYRWKLSAVFLSFFFFQAALATETKKENFWNHTFAAGSPNIGYFANDIRRPSVGTGLRGGYEISKRIETFLQFDWSYTHRLRTNFHFVDIGPRLSCTFWKDFYALGGGGITWASSSIGTPIPGFSTTDAVTRTAWFVGAGLGKVLIQGSGVSIGAETELIYRRISSTNFYQPLVRVYLKYEF